MPGPFELPGDLLVWFAIACLLAVAGIVVLAIIAVKLWLLLVLFGHDDLDVDDEDVLA
jgi:hypothetical protein